MIHIKLPERLKNLSPAEIRSTITSDETWAFTEERRTDAASRTESRIEAHDLFNLFTANIIKAKTDFVR